MTLQPRNLTMMTDLYQLTMMYGYFKHGMTKNQAVFDLFFRERENSAYALMAGTESIIEYINNLHFAEEDIEYLQSLNLFDEPFLDELRKLDVKGEIYGMKEGTVVFPYEPLLRVKAPIMEAQLVETALLNLVNHQTLIATKASRVAYAAQGDEVMEFGLRRAQGPDAGIYGARAAVIGGCSGTSNVFTGQMYHVALKGTHAHSLWIPMIRCAAACPMRLRCLTNSRPKGISPSASAWILGILRIFPNAREKCWMTRAIPTSRSLPLAIWTKRSFAI